MTFSRYAVFFLPDQPDLAEFGARWLGWDVQAGRAVEMVDIDGIDKITLTPRRYGFHATLKPPFRLAEGQTQDDLASALGNLARNCAPAACDGLELTAMGRFLALTPIGDTSGVDRIAAACVQELDVFRAMPDEAEILRRRKAGLSARQAEMLERWGYPHVMEEFRFHLTLTARLPRAQLAHWMATVRKALPPLPAPLEIGAVALVGERRDNGCFELIERYALTG